MNKIYRYISIEIQANAQTFLLLIYMKMCFLRRIDREIEIANIFTLSLKNGTVSI